MDDLVIVGGGGLAREVACIVDQINEARPTWNLLGFLDPDPTKRGSMLCRRPVLGDDSFLASRRYPLHVAIGIGSPAASARIAARLAPMGHLRFPNLIHPSVIMDRQGVEFGQGNIVAAGNILTTDIRFGSFNFLNLNCTVGHDTVVGDSNTINPGVQISGGVNVGNRCLVGTGAAILQNRRLGDDAVVGAGAVVAEDVAPGVTVVGVPARPRAAPGTSTGALAS